MTASMDSSSSSSSSSSSTSTSSRRHKSGRKCNPVPAAVLLGCVLLLASVTVSQGAKLAPDDFLVGVTLNNKDTNTGGIYKVFSSSGGYKDQIPVPGCTTPTHDTDGAAFSIDGTQIWATCYYQDVVTVIDATLDSHPAIGMLPGSASGAEATYSAASGPNATMYIGYFDGPIMQYSTLAPSNGIVSTITVPDASFIQVDADGTTIFYTSLTLGGSIGRVDIATNSPMPDFVGGASEIYGGIALLPPFDGVTGGLLVAIRQTNTVQRLDGSGNVVQTYQSSSLGNVASVALLSDGVTFWAGDFDNGFVVKFTLDGGQQAAIDTTSAGPTPSLYAYSITPVPKPTTCAGTGAGQGLVVALGSSATTAANAAKVCAVLGLPQTKVTAKNRHAVVIALTQCIGSAPRSVAVAKKQAVAAWVKAAPDFGGKCVWYYAHSYDEHTYTALGTGGAAGAGSCTAFLPVLCGQL